ncbi:MAG: MCE family protein [Thermoleophilaceae bacterium]|nr:MCE family protein [Thermoleophilaceae bacterium]
MRYSDIPRGNKQRSGLGPVTMGVIALVVIVSVTYVAFTKFNPFHHPYELTAIFDDAGDVNSRAPVRIAGVDVGEVVKVEPMENGTAKVTMEIEEKGLPIRKDANVKVRSRLFLEGNYFVDIHPGTPQAAELKEGQPIPPNQTAAPVQNGEVLTALQSDTRESLQTLLAELSTAYKGQGARGLNNSIKYWERSFRDSSQVNEATLGTEPGDLQRVLKGQSRVFRALSRDENALANLVTDLNVTFAAFARQEDNLRAAIPALRDVLKVGRPALQSLNRALPQIRAFANDALPAARSSDRALTVQLPLIKQLRGLVSRNEARGLVADLLPTVPALVSLNKNSTRTFAETRALSSCQNNVLVPFAKEPIPDPDFPLNSGQPFFKQTSRAFVGLAGESRLADANSSYFRTQGGGGPTTVVSTGESGEKLFGQSALPIDSARPIAPAKRPVFRPGIPCETQETPNLNAASGQAETSTTSTGKLTAKQQLEFDEEKAQIEEHLRREKRGLPTLDPLDFSERGEILQARKLGLRWTEAGKLVKREGKR